MTRRTKLQGASAVGTTVLALWYGAALLPEATWTQRMVLVAGVEAVLGFLALGWSLTSTNSLFVRTFGIYLIVRLLIVFAAVAVLNVVGVAIAAPLTALAFTYFVTSLVQIPFFMRAQS
jgi:hypothetical protein